MTVTRYAGRGNWHQLLLSGEWEPLAASGDQSLATGAGGLRAAVARGKRVPAERFSSSRMRRSDCSCAILWATDGTISLRKPGQRGENSVHFSSCSRGLADDVAALLTAIRYCRARIQTVTSGYRNPVYMVWVRGVDYQTLFLDRVGGFGPRSAPAERLRAASNKGIKANTNVDTVPAEMMWRVQFLMQHHGISAPAYGCGGWGRSGGRAW